MIKITIYQNRNQQFVGFDCLGHAEYADENDVVCAGTSALVINCINSIESLTGDSFSCDINEENGMINFRLEEKLGNDTQLLLKSLVLGLQEMERNYDAYIDVIFEEV